MCPSQGDQFAYSSHGIKRHFDMLQTHFDHHGRLSAASHKPPRRTTRPTDLRVRRPQTVLATSLGHSTLSEPNSPPTNSSASPKFTRCQQAAFTAAQRSHTESHLQGSSPKDARQSLTHVLQSLGACARRPRRRCSQIPGGSSFSSPRPTVTLADVADAYAAPERQTEDMGAKNDGFDADGLRERADVRESEARRRERDRAEARAEEASREAGRDVVRADLREGRISREDFARLAREAGISAREVAATLREHRPAQAAPAPAPSPSAAARSLATAAAAKARGVEELRRGETAEAAATFSRAAELAAAARAEPGSGSDGVTGEALRLQAAAELNLALCQLKLHAWEEAAAASSRALAAGEGEADTWAATRTKAFYRRARARLGQGRRRCRWQWLGGRDRRRKLGRLGGRGERRGRLSTGSSGSQRPQRRGERRCQCGAVGTAIPSAPAGRGTIAVAAAQRCCTRRPTDHCCRQCRPPPDECRAACQRCRTACRVAGC